MYINSEDAAGASGYTPSTFINIGEKITGSFSEALEARMTGLIHALKDDKITQQEVAAIENLVMMVMRGESPAVTLEVTLGEEDESEVLYDGVSAYLYANAEINQISLLNSWLFKGISAQTESFNKALSLLTA